MMRMEVLGLSTAQAQKRLHEVGPNEITTHQRRTALTIFLEQFPTFLNGILLIAAVFSYILHDFIDGSFILAIIVLNGIFGFVQEYRAEKSLEKLKSYSTPTVRVLRNGKEKEISSLEVVPGDIVILSEGDRIVADGTLIKEADLEVDESILTGESLPVHKELNATCYSGTLIVKGRGMMQVTTTGNQTKFGQIAQTLSTLRTDRTPLQKQLTGLGRILSALAIAIALILVPFGLYQNLALETLFLLVISVAVAAIPEGLPAVITIALAIGTNRLARRKAIIRQMPAIETLGAIQIILVDKTGTLTQNRMRVKDIYLPNEKNRNHLLLAASLGNTATLLKREDNTLDVAGDMTDGALLLWAHEQEDNASSHIKVGKVLDEFVFDSESKTVTTVWEHHEKPLVYVRGAPEAILERSKLSQKERDDLTAKYTEYAKEGLRVIGFGYKEEGVTKGNSRTLYEQNLTFLGFAALYDPPRPEVAKAVAAAKRAGIRPIMVTGDNEITALSIAKEIGFIDKNEEVINGEELEKLSDDELKNLLPRVSIFARSQPQDKLRIATLLQDQGYIVGVTGDGVNDALALKKANVGIAMGDSGTDVAKEASDIILTDDNFSTLVQAIEEGRAIYRNIVTAILYLLTSNLSELALVLSSTVLGLPVVLLPTQILWINLVTDGVPALALATDPSSHGMLNNPPRNPTVPLLTKARITKIVLGGVGLAFILITIYIALLQNTDEKLARTIIFNLLILSHLVLALIVRGRNLFTAPKLLYLTILGTIILQGVITFTPAFQNLFKVGF